MRFFKYGFNAPIVQTGNVPSFDGFKPEESEEEYLARKLFPDENTGLIPTELVAAAHAYNVARNHAALEHNLNKYYSGDPGTPGRQYSHLMKLEDEVLGR